MERTETPWLSNTEFLARLNARAAQRRIPLSGSIDLTHRCNLRCMHCYLGSKGARCKRRREELGTPQWLAVIEDIVDAGCLCLLITGGEPLLRKDFAEIYSHAKEKGLLVTVFTNGTLITDDLLDLFEDLPPRGIEVTLYGATAETYERITRVRGSHERCLEGIERLRDRGIKLTLKTVLMTLNSHEFGQMENMAHDYGTRFRFDAAVFPCFDGDKKPTLFRVDPAEAVEKEFSDDRRARQWKDYFRKLEGLSVKDTLYTCGAGVTSFHIGPYGNLQPCLMVHDPQYNVAAGNFHEGWKETISGITERKVGPGHTCHQCDKRLLCGYCPAFFKLENGAEEVFSEYLCALGQHRFEQIQNGHEEGRLNES